MKRKDLSSVPSTALLMGEPIAATSALAQSRGGSGSGMMGGYGAGRMGSGYGGIWLPMLKRVDKEGASALGRELLALLQKVCSRLTT